MKCESGSEQPVSVRHFHKIGRVVTAGIIDARYTLLECSNQLTVGESEADAVTSSFEEAAPISDCTKQTGAISGLHWHMAPLKKATSLDDAVGAVDELPAANGCLSFDQPAGGWQLIVAILKTLDFWPRFLGEFSLAEADSNVAIAVAAIVSKDLHSLSSFQFDSSL